MAMRHQRARRRNRGIDPRIGGGHEDSVGVRFDQVAERGHSAYMIGMAGGSTARSRHPGCVPGSNPPRALLFAARWMPECIRHDGEMMRSWLDRSDERRVGKECVRTCRLEGAPDT